ncbi:MAG: segregation/condensation protein A [Candidatus Omnitrophica bacterium]|nr:segregation/condensation protein A [Candidatus Omnitrophota bacterium]
MSYKVKLNIFEGPLDLLLFLIKKDKIDIYDIPISDVTQQYLDYLELMKMLDLEIAGEFLVIAATLIHIKSKMLLPQEENEEGAEEEEDPRDELVRKLLEYKKYKEAASHLQERFEDRKSLFLRRGEGSKAKIVSDDGTEYFEASLFDLITAFRKILTTVPKETFHKVVKNEYTVSDKIHEIYHILAKDPRIYFSALFSRARCKDEVIAIFLAVLELIKMREIFVAQKGPFEEIEIIRNPELVKGAAKGE